MRKMQRPILFGLLMLLAVLAFGGRSVRAEAPSIVDEADIISVANEESMNAQIRQIEDQYQTRVMVLTDYDITVVSASDLD